MGSVFVLQYGSVGAAAVSEFALFAWDDRLSMFYFHEQHEPLWRHAYRGDVGAMLQAAFADYQQIISKCDDFDSASLSQLAAAGGDEYATYTALAHRQATGATILVWNAARQSAWAYMKEISSDGDVSVSAAATAPAAREADSSGRSLTSCASVSAGLRRLWT